MTIIIIAFFIIVLFFIVLSHESDARESAWKQQELQDHILELDEMATINKEKRMRVQSLVETIGGADIDVRYCYDPERRFIVNELASTIIIDEMALDFDDIISFDVKDNATVCTSSFTSPGSAKTSTNTGSMLGRAVVGGVLTGGIGAIIGGATASKTTTIESGTTTTTSSTRHDYSIVVTVKRLKSPIITLNTGTDERVTEQIAGILSVIINQNNHNINNKKLLESPSPKESHSNADELMKLVELKKMGVLTDEEFESQKAKVLNR